MLPQAFVSLHDYRFFVETSCCLRGEKCFPLILFFHRPSLLSSLSGLDFPTIIFRSTTAPWVFGLGDVKAIFLTVAFSHTRACACRD